MDEEYRLHVLERYEAQLFSDRDWFPEDPTPEPDENLLYEEARDFAMTCWERED